MTRRCLAALLLAGLAIPAAAQEVGLDMFLEQRVVEELAADGTILSRLGVTRDVERVGDKMLVSLVDPATRRAAASTKIDKLPADREAAVATVTQVVANLAAQLATTTTAGAATATAMKTVLDEERRQRELRERAETAYKREAILFNDHAVVTSTGETTTTQLRMTPYRNDRRLSVPEFLEVVERHDLVAQYHRRRTIGLGVAIVGGAGSFAGIILAVGKGRYDPEWSCNINRPGYSSCKAAENMRNDERRSDARKWVKIGLGISLGSAIATVVGYYFIARGTTLDERDAYDMADAYNAKLRIKHGLPAVSRRSAPRFEEVAITPYADDDGAGLALTRRF